MSGRKEIMYTITQFGTLLLIVVTGITILLFAWMRSLRIAKPTSDDLKHGNAESVTGKALSELSADPPNFRSMIDVLRDNVTTTANGAGKMFLVETEKQRAMKHVDAQTFKSIRLSYLLSMKSVARGKEK